MRRIPRTSLTSLWFNTEQKIASAVLVFRTVHVESVAFCHYSGHTS